MNAVIESATLPKPFLQGIIGDYSRLINNIDGIIKETGYKQNFIAKKLSLPLSTFYLKKRTRSFNVDEVSRIVDMLDEDLVAENRYLLSLAESRWSEETVSYDEMMKLLEE
jgi:predicted transcriptional regulator